MVLMAFAEPQVLQIFTLNKIYPKHISHIYIYKSIYSYKISINCRLSALSNSINLRQCHTFQVARYACSWLLHMQAIICKMQRCVYNVLYVYFHITKKRDEKKKCAANALLKLYLCAQPMKRTFIFLCIVATGHPQIHPRNHLDARKEKWWKWKIMLHYCCRAAQQLHPLTICVGTFSFGKFWKYKEKIGNFYNKYCWYNEFN